MPETQGASKDHFQFLLTGIPPEQICILLLYVVVGNCDSFTCPQACDRHTILVGVAGFHGWEITASAALEEAAQRDSKRRKVQEEAQDWL